MKIVNKNTGSFLIFVVDNLKFKATNYINQYEPGIESEISVGLSDAQKDDIIDIILSDPKYVDYVKESNFNDWQFWIDKYYTDHPEEQPQNWPHRIFITNDQIAKLVADEACIVWYNSLFETPKNPYIKNGGSIIYLNVIEPEARALLEGMGVTIENEPNVQN